MTLFYKITPEDRLKRIEVSDSYSDIMKQIVRYRGLYLISTNVFVNASVDDVVSMMRQAGALVYRKQTTHANRVGYAISTSQGVIIAHTIIFPNRKVVSVDGERLPCSKRQYRWLRFASGKNNWPLLKYQSL